MKNLLIIIALFFANLMFAQVQKDFIVTLKGDTIFGKVTNANWYSLSKSIEFTSEIGITSKFKPLEITRSQAWLMAYVSRGDGQTQSDLAAQMSLGKVAIGGLIDRLEKTEMIERRAEATDRRVKRIHLTDKGSKVIRSMRKLTMEANKEILAGISMKQIKQAASVLARIKKNTESMME